jgi:hypothetical protein
MLHGLGNLSRGEFTILKKYGAKYFTAINTFSRERNGGGGRRHFLDKVSSQKAIIGIIS